MRSESCLCTFTFLKQYLTRAKVITKTLGGSAVEAFWSGTSFLLASTIFQPILGSLSDVFGRKLLIHFSLLLFLTGSVVIATSNQFTTILIGRTIQGAGGGGIICVTALIVVDKVPLKERGNWLSLLGATFSVGNVSGPLLGGALAKETLWRWIFWINLPFIGVGGISITIFLKANKRPGSFLGKLKELDWIGMGLFLTSTTGFLIPISRGGIEYPWSSWHTLVPLLVCTTGLVALAIHQEYVAKCPFVHTSIFKNRSAAIILTLTVLYGLILSAVLFYLPLYFEAVKGMSPVMAGVAILPWTLTLAPSAMVR
jgi:MFS family permease